MKIDQPIEVLKFRLSKLNEAYQNYVIEGKVDVLSYPATNNRELAKQFEYAIQILETNNNNQP